MQLAIRVQISATRCVFSWLIWELYKHIIKALLRSVGTVGKEIACGNNLTFIFRTISDQRTEQSPSPCNNTLTISKHRQTSNKRQKVTPVQFKVIEKNRPLFLRLKKVSTMQVQADYWNKFRDWNESGKNE